MGWQDAPVVSKSWQDAPLANQEPQPPQTTVQPVIEAEPPSTMSVVGESLTREMPSNILGAPMDIVNLLTNTVRSGAQVLSGKGDEPYQPVPAIGGSDFFKENAFNEIADRDEYTPKQRLLGNTLTLGAEAMTGGVGLASKANKAQDAAGILGDVIEPYITRPVAQVAQDTAAGIGAGGGLTAAQETDQGPIATLLMTILGGAGAAGGAKTAETYTPVIGRNALANRETQLPDGTSVRKRALDDASQIADEAVTNKPQAIQNINESLDDADELGIVDPTLGPASGDIGLSMLEVRQRTNDPQKFIEQDQKIRTGVTQKFGEFRNDEADVTAPQRASQKLIDDELNASQNEINTLKEQEVNSEQGLRDLERQREEITAQIEARRGSEGRASAELNEQLGATLDEKTKVKNDAFERSAEGVDVDANSLLKTVKSVDDELPALSPPEDKLPSWISDKIGKFIPESGSLEGPDSKAGLIPADDVLKLRRTLSTEASTARAQGKFGQAEQLDKLRKRINETIELDPRFKEANTNYKENYAPFFAEGYGQKYRDTVQRGDGTGSADPENIASFFLNKTSSAADDLKRIVEVAPDKAAADNAIELYFDASLARKNLTPKAIRDFIADNNDILPDNVKEKYQGVVKSMMNNDEAKDSSLKQLKQLKSEIRKSESDFKQKERSLQSGPFGKMSRYDSDKYVGDILGGKDRNQQIDTVIKEIGDDKEAMDGFKEATVRWMQKKIAGTDASATDIPDTDVAGRPILYSKLTRVFDDNREALSKIFTPDEMNDLNRLHKVMSKQGNLSRRATTGSDTAEKLTQTEQQALDVIEGALRLKFGMIKGGGIMATGKKLKNRLFGMNKRSERAQEILTRMAYDPKVAKHVLEVDQLNFENGKWFSELNALISADQAIDESNEDE